MKIKVSRKFLGKSLSRFLRKASLMAISIFTLGTVTAFFVAGCSQGDSEYNVNLELSPEGTGEVGGAGTYQPGEEVTVEAQPDEGYRFAKWTENGEIVSTEQNYTFEIEKGRDLTAGFQLDWPEAEIEETAKQALTVYWHQSPPGGLAGGAAEAREEGELKLHYPGLSEFAEEAEINIKDTIHGKDRVEVEAALEYPHVEEEDYTELEEEIVQEITEAAAEGPVSLRDIFTQTLRGHELSRETATKAVSIEKREEQTDQDGTTEEKLKAVQIDPPGELFASFDELYREAVAARVEEVTVETGEDRVFKERENAARAVFDGQNITLKADGPQDRTIDPYYLLEETGLLLPQNQQRLPLAYLWEEVTGQREHCPYSKHSPADYFSRLEFGEDTRHGRLTVHLTAPYFAATQRSTTGYIDLDTLKANLFLNTSGMPDSDLTWCPAGNRTAYSWVQMGSGFAVLDVYDLQSEKLIEVTSLDKFKEQAGEGFMGEFKDIQWSEDSRYLYFTSREHHPGEEEEQGEIISWKLDVEEEELVIRG